MSDSAETPNTSLSSLEKIKASPSVKCRMSSVKEWMHRMRPARLVIVLILSIVYFLVVLVFSHITHALTLLVQCYHMVCNIIALSGSLVMVKHMKSPFRPAKIRQQQQQPASVEEVRLHDAPGAPASQPAPATAAATDTEDREGTLKNTFGWARIDVLTMLCMCVFMASLCFSSLVEAVRKLLHISHQDAMHFPLVVLYIGAAGLLLHGLCYLLIGGYTHNQITFLQVSSRNEQSGPRPVEVVRDLCTTAFVLVGAGAVYLVEDEDVAKFIDPVLAIASCLLLFGLSFPYMRASGLILLQTIPATIDIAVFKEKLLKTFPTIYNVHDLHIWQLTAKKYVSTAHLIFSNETAYETVIRAIEQFFHDQGICIVTIQPEFLVAHGKAIIGGEGAVAIGDKGNCLMNCSHPECQEKGCCNLDSEDNLCRTTGDEGPATKPPATEIK